MSRCFTYKWQKNPCKSVFQTWICHSLLCLPRYNFEYFHYNDVMMSAMASQITSFTVVYSTAYSGADQRKHESSASLALVRGIHIPCTNGQQRWKYFHLMTSSLRLKCMRKISIYHWYKAVTGSDTEWSTLWEHYRYMARYLIGSSNIYAMF